MPIARRRVARIALAGAGGVLVALGLAQLLLPALAAQRVRSELGHYGTVRSASVSAFPAVELLWGHAQSLSVVAASLSMSLSRASALLWEARGVGRLDASAQSMRLESLEMQRVSLRKRGAELSIVGSLAASALRAALPGSAEVQVLGGVSNGVRVRVSGSLLGVTGAVDALLDVRDGKLVAQPLGIPFAGSLALTLLSAPHIHLQSFDLTGLSTGAAQPGDGEGPDYLVRIRAQLR